MSNISQFFYRDSYFTKKHDENNPNPNLINLFHKDSSIKNDSTNNKDNDNNNLENKSGRNSNNKSDSNDYDLYDEEIELFYAKVDTIIPIDNKLNSKAIYNIKIRSSLNFNDSWIKSCTLDDLFNFREYLLKYTYSVINLTSNNNKTKKDKNDIIKIENKEGRSSVEKSESNDLDFCDDELELFYAKVETIIPIDDKLNNDAIYNIKIRSSLNFNDFWIKSCTLDELYDLREYLLKYVSSVINLPFPQKSWMRFLPYIGYKYDERNWDILLENKFLLDDFFSTICKDKEMYKLSEFISFFSKPVNQRNTINLFYN